MTKETGDQVLIVALCSLILQKVCIQWKTKQKDCKNRWSTSKVNKYLQDGMDGRLSSEDIKALVKELILIEVEKRNVVLQQEIKVRKC